MEGEINSGSRGGRFGYGPPRLQQEHKRVNASETGNEKGLHHSTEGDFPEGSSQLVRKKRSRDDEGTPQGDAANEEEASAETLQEETILSKAMEDNIQQLRQRVDSFTHQVSGLLETRKSYFLDASTTFEEGILQLHQRVLEIWEEDIEGLRNVDIVNEEIYTRLREARQVLEKLQASASRVSRLRAAAMFDDSSMTHRAGCPRPLVDIWEQDLVQVFSEGFAAVTESRTFECCGLNNAKYSLDEV